MSDTSTSSDTAPEALAVTDRATPEAPAAFAVSFGGNRGSGLARGKRQARAGTPPTTPTPSAAPSGYVPSAVQIVTAASSYQHPFASEAPVAPEVTAVIPTSVEPTVETNPAPVAVAEAETPAPLTPVPTVATASTPDVMTPDANPVLAAPVAASPVSAVSPVVAKAPASGPARKAELNILPPAEARRTAQSWETPAAKASAAPAPRPASPSAPGERPVFRPVRRSEVPMLELAPGASESGGGGGSGRDGRGSARPARPGRDFRENRQPRDPRDAREPRQPRDPRDGRPVDRPKAANPAPAPQATPSRKPTGFVGWLKGLFTETPGGAPPAGPSAAKGTAPASGTPSAPAPSGPRPARTGGRPSDGKDLPPRNDSRGPRPEFAPRGESAPGDFGQSEGPGGQPGPGRRRRRGGRGRGRGPGGPGGANGSGGPAPGGSAPRSESGPAQV